VQAICWPTEDHTQVPTKKMKREMASIFAWLANFGKKKKKCTNRVGVDG